MTARPKRRLPAFSIRTLLILMTLACAYAACWWPTKNQGTRDVDDYNRASDWGLQPSTAVVPLIVRFDGAADLDADSSKRAADGLRNVITVPKRRYYFWFFGYVAKLPYERAINDVSVPAEVADPLPNESEDSGLIIVSPEELDASRRQKAKFIERLRSGEFSRPSSETP